MSFLDAIARSPVLLADGGIETRWEIAVSPENNAEVRRVTLTNHDARPHELELTSYAEVVQYRADGVLRCCPHGVRVGSRCRCGQECPHAVGVQRV